MINAVGRDIPEEILKATGKEVFQGTHHFDGHVYDTASHKVRCVINSNGSKLVDSIHDVLVKCGIQDGMTLSFHHHFRNGDKVLNMVMEEVHAMGIKNITVCASSSESRTMISCTCSMTVPSQTSNPPVCAVPSDRPFLTAVCRDWPSCVPTVPVPEPS